MKPGSPVDLNLLGVFEAIYTQGGVTRAARALHVTQSAVSHSLARLRQRFDDPLFVRAGNALVPTALARSIIVPIRHALREVDVAIGAASGFDPATSARTFRVGLRQSSEVRLFVDLVARVGQLAPQVTLASVSFRRGNLAQALAVGELDMAVDIPSKGSEGLHAVLLQTDRLVVAARRGHPRIAGAIDLPTYAAAEHVVASPRPTGPAAEDQALAALGVDRRVAVRCQNIWTAWRIVSESDMVLTLRQSQVAPLSQVAANQVLPPPFDSAAPTLHLFWHETSHRDAGCAWLRALIGEVARSS